VRPKEQLYAARIGKEGSRVSRSITEEDRPRAAGFSRTTRFLACNERRLLKKYPKQWIALYGGKVRASAKSLDEVISKLKKLGLPANQSLIWYMDTSGRKIIL
jgi:uncharacterized protein DUF5678